MLKIPYTQLQLLAALTRIDESKLDEEKLKEIVDEFEDQLPKEAGDRNKKVAEFHGIGMETLVNSPNYKILCQEYQENFIRQLVDALKEKLALTDIQAWALIMHSQGLL